MPRPLISVIIPAYNVQTRIDKCLTTVLAQSYENLEIILINDGSTDNTGDICQKYADMDSRVHYIQTPNQGVSSTRNEGLKIMKGDFVTFIDSDDYISQYFIENLYHAIKISESDISSCQFKLVHDDYGEQNIKLKNSDELIRMIDSEEALYRMFFHDDLEISAWAKLYSRDLIEDVYFEAGKIYEDILFQPEIVMKANKIAFHQLADYFHHYTENSIQHSDFNLNKLAAVEHMELIHDQYISVMSSDSIKTAWKYRYFDNICLILFDIDQTEYPEVIDSLWSKLKSVRSDVLLNSHPNAKNARLGALVSYFGYNLMKFIFNSYRKIK